LFGGDRQLKRNRDSLTILAISLTIVKESRFLAPLPDRSPQLHKKMSDAHKKQALLNLSSILNPNLEDALPSTEDPLLAAAGAVGRYLGLTIRPPASWESNYRQKDPLEAIARASRIRIRRVRLTGKWWKKDGGAIVAYTKDNQPRALLPKKGGGYEIFNPVTREKSLLVSETANNLQQRAYTFYPPLPDGKVNAWTLVTFAFRGRVGDVIFLVAGGVCATLVGMITPQATGFLVDFAIPGANRGLLLQMGLGLLFASLGVTLFNLVQSFATLRLQTLASALTQAAIWDRLLSLPAGFFRKYASGDLQNRASAIEAMRQKLSGTILSSLFTSFFSLLNLGLCVIYSPPMAVVAVGVAAVSIVVTTVAGVITRRKMRPLQELAGEIFGLTVQLIGGVSQLRIAGAEERAFAFWAQKYTQRMKLLLSTQLIEDWQALFNTVLPTISSGLLYVVAVYFLGETGISTGTFLAFNTAFGTFVSGATGLSGMLLDVLEITVYWERAKPILQEEPEVSLNKLDPGPLQGYIKIDRVSFRYGEDGPKVLQDATIEAAPGEFIAIVGPSGSGKSTLVRLLLGFEKPTQGRILYDAQDLSSLDATAVRRQLGVVLQDAKINSGSIYSQIVGSAIVSRQDAWEAAGMAGLADDIKAMPMEMNTIVSEGGTNLSGGQRQRLLIARALVLRPAIIIFDEATSNLDNRTQKIVMESLASLAVTRVIIAHRLTTIAGADRVYALDKGRVKLQHGGE